MKNKITLLFNPFYRIAGWQSFGIGIVVLIIATYIGFLNGVCFPGALDVKFTSGVPLSNAFVYQLIGVSSIILVMYIASLIFAKGTRFQDIVGTATLAHFPYLFIALLGFLTSTQAVGDLENTAMNLDINAMLAVLGANIGLIMSALLTIPFAIWYLILLYKAFSVSTGVTGVKAIGIFVGIIFIAEILSLLCIILIIRFL